MTIFTLTLYPWVTTAAFSEAGAYVIAAIYESVLSSRIQLQRNKKKTERDRWSHKQDFSRSRLALPASSTSSEWTHQADTKWWAWIKTPSVCSSPTDEARVKETFVKCSLIFLKISISHTHTRETPAKTRLCGKILWRLGFYATGIVSHFRILEANLSFPVQTSFRRPVFSDESHFFNFVVLRHNKTQTWQEWAWAWTNWRW